MPSDATMKVNLSHDGLHEVERKIEAALASARRGDLIEGDEVMLELKAMSKARRAGNKTVTS